MSCTMLTRKARKMGMTEHDILVALNAINDTAFQNDEDCTLTSPERNQEDITIRKDAFTKLSTEAIEVVKLVIDAPAELVELVSPTRKQPTRNVVRRFLTSVLKWRHKKVDAVFTELKKYVEGL